MTTGANPGTTDRRETLRGVTGPTTCSSSLTGPSTPHGNRNGLAFPFGSDQRPVGCLELASFAVLAMPLRSSGSVAYATWLGEVPEFRVGPPSIAHLVAQVLLENIFVPPSGPRVMSNSHASDLTK